jgi:tetratricopeptide (TPR) repeat protein
MTHKKTGTPRKKATRKKQSSKHKKVSSTTPPVITDRRAMEKTMFDIGRLLEQQNFESIEEANAFLNQFVGAKHIPVSTENMTPIERAQEKMYEAWDATGKRRVKLTEEALEISPDCADAYVLLAEETARSPEAALKLYEQGMQAGERALGPEAFQEAVGHFWGLFETRPYMRARAGVAECLWATGKFEEAIFHYREMLRLNPGDNQGNRYMLARLLLKQGKNEELGQLLDQYDEEGSAEWLYTRALWLYRRDGDSRKATKALKEAFEQNPFVPLYLSGLKETPRRLPEYMGFGDENEAIHYFVENVEAWLDTPGALEWFAISFKDVLRDVEKKGIM